VCQSRNKPSDPIRPSPFSYDYEDVDASGANLMMTYMEPQIAGYVGMTLKANNKEYVVGHADNYEYVDPIDESVAKNQVGSSSRADYLPEYYI